MNRVVLEKKNNYAVIAFALTIISILIIQQNLVAGEQGIKNVALLRLDAVLENTLKDATAVGMAR